MEGVGWLCSIVWPRIKTCDQIVIKISLLSNTVFESEGQHFPWRITSAWEIVKISSWACNTNGQIVALSSLRQGIIGSSPTAGLEDIIKADHLQQIELLLQLHVKIPYEALLGQSRGNNHAGAAVSMRMLSMLTVSNQGIELPQSLKLIGMLSSLMKGYAPTII